MKAHASSVFSAPIWCAAWSIRVFSSSEGDWGRGRGKGKRRERGGGGGKERIRGGERKRREEERERRGEGEQSGGERTEDYNLHFILLLLIISPLSNFKT